MTSLASPMRVRAHFAFMLILLFILGFAPAGALAQIAGDFNNDGFADLAIGAPDDGVGNTIDAGMVHVLYGSADGLTTTGSQLWHLNRENVPEQVEEGDRFGATLAAGDFNGDGFDDLAIGIPGREIGSDSSAGAVIILFGSAGGLAADGAQYIHQDTDGVLDGAETNDSFGAAMAAGNFNGDGFDDLAVGVPGERADIEGNAGAINVLYGDGSGLSATDDQFFQQGEDDIQGSPQADDRFGAVLAAGDFDNDGNDDLAVGTPAEDDDSGVVHVLSGTAGGLIGVQAQTWTQDVDGIPENAEEDDDFGAALAVGDFNNDGFADLAIGVPGEDRGEHDNAGVVHVLFGSASGLSNVGDELWSQDSDGIAEKTEEGDRFGFSLAAGQFDNDAFADLAIGVPGESPGGVSEAGAVTVLFGTGSGFGPAGDELWHQDVDGILDNCEVDDRFGTVLCSGDFNNDGLADLAVGMPFENVGGADAGAVAVIYGSNGGLRAGPDQFWHQNRDNVAEECEAEDHFGGGNAP